MEKISSIFEQFKNVGYLYSLICLIVNLFTKAIPHTMVVIACVIIIVIIGLDLIGMIISLFGGMDGLSWVTLILNIVAIALSIIFICFKTKIFEFLQITNDINTFEWICTGLTIYYFITQVLTLIPDIIATLIADDDIII